MILVRGNDKKCIWAEKEQNMSIKKSVRQRNTLSQRYYLCLRFLHTDFKAQPHKDMKNRIIGGYCETVVGIKEDLHR